MPNLVPIQTVRALADTLYLALLTDPIRNRKATTQDASGYVAQGAITRAYLVGGSIYGLPDKPEAPEAIEPDRRGSRLTAPNADSTAVRLAQYIRVSGLRGVAVLDRFSTNETRHLSAAGRATRPYPFDSRGECPSERMNWQPVAEDDTVSEREVRHLRKYRDSMKGAKFAASMANEVAERSRAYWRAALPFWPYDSKHGRFIDGVQFGRNDRIFPDGSTLSDRREAWESVNGDLIERLQAKRERVASELDRLIAEQEEERAYDKRHSVRVKVAC